MMIGSSFGEHGIKEWGIDWIIFKTLSVIEVCWLDAPVSSVRVCQLVISYSFLLYMVNTSIFSPDVLTLDLGNNLFFSFRTAIPWEAPHYCPYMH